MNCITAVLRTFCMVRIGKNHLKVKNVVHGREKKLFLVSPKKSRQFFAPFLAGVRTGRPRGSIARPFHFLFLRCCQSTLKRGVGLITTFFPVYTTNQLILIFYFIESTGRMAFFFKFPKTGSNSM